MIAAYRAELRKIFSLRSTYVMLIFALVLLGFFAFYTEGIKAGVSSTAANDPHKLSNLVNATVTNLAFFASLVGILLFTHEYRYNTIIYTLTSSKSRTRVLVAKLLAGSLFSILFTVLVSALAVVFMLVGLAIKDVPLVAQTFSADLAWRVVFFGWAWAMFAMLIAAFVRQQVGTIATYFVFPALGESLLGLLLKDNRIYLPFMALQQVTGGLSETTRTLTPEKAAIVVGIYVVVGWLIAWVLFLRRDAT